MQAAIKVILLIGLGVVAINAADLNRGIDQQSGLTGQQGLDKTQQGVEQSNIGQQRPISMPRKYRAIDKEGVKDSLNKGTDKAAKAGEDLKENVRRTRDTMQQGLDRQQHKFGQDQGVQGVDQGKILGQGMDTQSVRKPRQMQRLVNIQHGRPM